VYDIDIVIGGDGRSIPLCRRGSGFDAAGLDYLIGKRTEYYDRRQRDRTLLHVLVGILKMFVYTFLAFLLFVFIFFLWMFTAHDQRAHLTKDFITQQTVFRVDPLSNAVTVQKQGSKIVCGQKVDGVNRAFDPDTEIAPDSQPIYGHDVSYNTIVIGGKLKDSCYGPSPIPAATVAKAFGGAADHGSFIKNAGWFDHQWLSEKSDAF